MTTIFYGFFYKKNKVLNSNTIYKFVILPVGTAAKVEFKNPIAQKSEDIIVLFEDILDNHYQSLLQKKEELLFLAAYEQWIKPNAGTYKKISFNSTKPKRDLLQICVQYGVSCLNTERIRFDSKQNDFLLLDGKKHQLSQLQTNTVPLLAVQTEILNYLSQKIDERIRNKVLYFRAKFKKQTVNDIVASEIISREELIKKTELFVVSQNTNLKAEVHKDIFNGIAENIKNEEVDKHIHKNYLVLPISVNIERPSHDFQTKWDWTPYFGKKPGQALKIILFADFFTDASKVAIKNVLKLKHEKNSITVGFRPYFKDQDQLQRLTAEVAMCVWSLYPEFFWSFLEKILSLQKNNLEEGLYKNVIDVGASLETIKQCALSRKMEKIIDYHLQSAQYLKIINTPVIFVGQEVHVGPLSSLDFKKMINRQQ